MRLCEVGCPHREGQVCNIKEQNVLTYCFFTLLKVQSIEYCEMLDKLNRYETVCMVPFVGLVFQSNTKPWEKLLKTSIHKYYPNKYLQTVKLQFAKAFISRLK